MKKISKIESLKIEMQNLLSNFRNKNISQEEAILEFEILLKKLDANNYNRNPFILELKEAFKNKIQQLNDFIIIQREINEIDFKIESIKIAYNIS